MSVAVLQAAHKTAVKPAAPKIKLTVVAPGSGPAASKGDLITVDYTGRLASGHIFGGSMAVKGDPAQPGRPPLAFTVGTGEAIPGVDQALLGQKVGARVHVVIPPALAYEDLGTQDGAVPPNATISFDFHVLAIQKKGENPQIRVVDLAPGSGPAVKALDTVTLHYTGTFLNGVKFDSSRDRNQPFSFQVGREQVVMGFDAGVIGMKKGGHRKITIPPALGYGSASGGPIPPNSTLVFDVELLDFKAPAAAPTTPSKG